MGYTTDFTGSLKLSGNLTIEQFEYINNLNDTRRMKRNVDVLMELHKGKFGLPGTNTNDNTPNEIYGLEGEYFVGGGGYGGQDRDDSILDYNQAPGHLSYDFDNFTEGFTENNRRIKEGLCQPGLWLGWRLQKIDDEVILVWDGGEKFYHYVEWLQYLITHFFDKWGVKLNGVIEWVGEDSEDRGRIRVEDSVIHVGYFEGSYVER